MGGDIGGSDILSRDVLGSREGRAVIPFAKGGGCGSMGLNIPVGPGSRVDIPAGPITAARKLEPRDLGLRDAGAPPGGEERGLPRSSWLTV